MKSFNLSEWALNHRAIVLFLLLVREDQTTLALRLLTEAHRAGLLRENRGVLRLASLEQVGNTADLPPYVPLWRFQVMN